MERSRGVLRGCCLGCIPICTDEPLHQLRRTANIQAMSSCQGLQQTLAVEHRVLKKKLVGHVKGPTQTGVVGPFLQP
jgi:hypothetical protein